MALHLLIWRHPRPAEVMGRCIGRSDVQVDPRRSKRLAHRIRRAARRHPNAPRVIWTSPLQRCAGVARWLKRWGWRHRIDARLSEVSFGCWEGRSWDQIGEAAVSAWCADFLQHAPGGGESVAALLARCQGWLDEARQDGVSTIWMVGHAGWMNAAAWLASRGAAAVPAAADWPAAPRHCQAVALDWP